MKVIHLSVECYPVAKVGGLADVVGALPKYQRQLGIDASVVMPFYDRPFTQKQTLVSIAKGEFNQGSERLTYEILEEVDQVLGFPLYLVKIPGKLDRQEVYMYADEAEQWIAFQHAVIHYLSTHDIKPDVVHCHDHHMGLMPFLLQHAVDYRNLQEIKTVFTVHNGQYQGWMGWNKGILLPAFDTWRWGLLDWDGIINPLAAAIKCSDAYTTVSEGYLEELYQEANGLQELFTHEKQKAVGIVNGIDDQYWDPATDEFLAKNYSASSVLGGKKTNKKWLCKEYKLDPNKPLVSFIGRFAIEKGADLLPDIVEELLSDEDFSSNMFILGSGDDEIKKRLERCQQVYGDRLGIFFGYNEELSHKVYAASDLILMPSRVEPCGLNQLYAMKYGTIPVVRSIGGLKDTVVDVEDGGYGFLFERANVVEIVSSIRKAIAVVDQKVEFAKLRKKIMGLDFSWTRSAKKYLELYDRL